MKIVIFGAGSIGVYLGGALLAGGADVLMIGRARMAERILHHGAHLTDLQGREVRLSGRQVPFTEDPGELGQADLILVTAVDNLLERPPRRFVHEAQGRAKQMLSELADHLRQRPGALALIDDRGGRQVTYAELGQEVAAAVAWLEEQGLRRGQAVLVFVPVSVDLYVALLALFRLGAVALLLDPGAGPEHLEQCCRRWPPKVCAS